MEITFLKFILFKFSSYFLHKAQITVIYFSESSKIRFNIIRACF